MADLTQASVSVYEKVLGLMFCSPPLAMSTQSRAENIAHTAMYTYKGGEQNISPSIFVPISNMS
jgi:hypothetical protein